MRNHKEAYSKLSFLLSRMVEESKNVAEKAKEIDPTPWSAKARHAKKITVNGEETVMLW